MSPGGLYWLFLASLLIVSGPFEQPVSAADSLAFTYDHGNGNQVSYRLFLPPNHDPAVEYPLVLYLHGYGYRGTDNQRQLWGITPLINATQSERFASYLLAPQLPVGLTINWLENPLAVEMTAGVVDEVMNNYLVDSQRVYATGFSWGATGTFGQLFSRPELYAAGVPVANSPPFVYAEELAPAYRDVPLWIFQGTLDQVVPVENPRAWVEAIRKVGGRPRYTEFPTAGHGINTLVYSDPDDELYPWLFSQRLVPEPATELLGDCNGDGTLNAGDLACVSSIGDRDAILNALNSLPGDLDGIGGVTFADFLALSTNFGTATTSYAEGNIDLEAGVEFADFLILSKNFGARGLARDVVVPEPHAGLLIVIANMALIVVRRRVT